MSNTTSGIHTGGTESSFLGVSDLLAECSRFLAAISKAIEAGPVETGDRLRTVGQLTMQMRSWITDLEAQTSALSLSGTEPGQVNRLADKARQLRIAAKLGEHWSGLTGDGVFRSGDVEIDCETAQGRWELLVQALLFGGLVRRSSAEATFLALKDAGLLDLERLVSEPATCQENITEIMSSYYRGVVDKSVKVKAIVENATTVQKLFLGDLHNAYNWYRENGISKVLRSLSQLDKMSLWYARELREIGVWPEVMATDSCYIDHHVKRAVGKLGLLRTNPVSPRQLGNREVVELIEDLFEGDVMPLYQTGKWLCSGESPERCQESCPVQDDCSVWR